MINVMVDLETVGNRAGCGIISLGAVVFDYEKNRLLDEHYSVVRLSSCEKAGLHSSQDTLDWWEKQSPQAREALLAARKKSGNKLLPKALQDFNAFLSGLGGKRSICVWGNGSDFDNAILYAAYAAVELPAAWEFWNSRCFRTLKNLTPIKSEPRQGVYHNALADAKYQALHANKILRHMNGLK